MTLIACGINYKTAPVSIREKVAFSPHTMAESLSHLLKQTKVEETVILTTCNRTELYCHAEHPSTLLSWLTQWHQLPMDALKHHFYVHQERAALRHLLTVACGLDSMMLGEPQILGQLKAAYSIASNCGAIGGYLDDVFQHVFKISKQVRATTDIGKNTVSIASAAVQLSKQVLKSIKDARVLLIGSGHTIDLVARHFQQQGVASFFIANRTRENAEELAKEVAGQALAIDELYEKLTDVDIVVSATACPIAILDQACVARAMEKRQQRSLMMIDLAVPRDIEANVGELEKVYLYNIDDLQDKVSQGHDGRQRAAVHAELIIENALEQFTRQQQSLLTVDSIRHYRTRLETMRDQEITFALRKLKQGDDPEQVLKKLAYRLTNKALHYPSKKLRKVGTDGNEELLKLTRQLFNDA